jgi:hypothetical protein
VLLSGLGPTTMSGAYHGPRAWSGLTKQDSDLRQTLSFIVHETVQLIVTLMNTLVHRVYVSIKNLLHMSHSP